jgi:hypothetical protein
VNSLLQCVRSKWSERLQPFIPWLAALVALAVLGHEAGTESVYVPTYHMDGAFQTASGLYRLDSGQFPGRDFFPYLGLASIYVLYVPFKLFGAHLTASTLAAHFMSYLLLAVSLALIIRLIRPVARWPSAFATAVATLSTINLVVTRRWWKFSTTIEAIARHSLNPGNSLKPIRAAAPALTAIAVWFIVRRIPATPLRYAFLGAIGGSVLWWSNDFGIPSAGALLVMALADAFLHSSLRARSVLTLLVSFVVTAASMITLATAFKPVAFIMYNFRDVARDQWWFFGPWGSKSRIFSVTDLTRLMVPSFTFALLVLAGVATFAVRARRWGATLLLYLGVVQLGGCLAAVIGGHFTFDYLTNFILWATLVTLVAAYHLTSLLVQRLLTPEKWQSLGTIGLILPLVSLYAYWSLDHAQRRSTAASNSRYFYDKGLGGYIAQEWAEYVKQARSADVPVAEEYWGIWSAARRSHPPTHVDSVIHALGQERLVFKEFIESKAILMISSREDVAATWHSWNFSANWWFYSALLREFSPVEVGPATIVWRRRVPTEWPMVDCAVDSKGRIQLRAETPSYFEVTVEYEVPDPSRSLFFVENQIQRVLDQKGWLSLDPKANRVTFPVMIPAAPTPQAIPFRRSPERSDSVGFTIKNCFAREIIIAPDQRIILPQRAVP